MLLPSDTHYATLRADLESDAQDLEAESWSLAVEPQHVKKLSKETVKRQDVIYGECDSGSQLGKEKRSRTKKIVFLELHLCQNVLLITHNAADTCEDLCVCCPSTSVPKKMCVLQPKQTLPRDVDQGSIRSQRTISLFELF